MKKNRITAMLLLTCLTAVMLCGTAFGDVIAEPNDDFFNQHSEQCTYVAREYYANGPTGYLEVFSEPNGKSEGFAKNGEVFWVDYTYLDGNTQWGIVIYDIDNGLLESSDDWNSSNGWVKMGEMTLKYDSQEFVNDNLSAIVSAEDKEVDYSGVYGKEIVFWTFPHSGDDFGDDMVISAADGLEFDSYYTDDEGLVWGRCGYFYGYRDFWICISDPANEHLSVTDHTPNFFTAAPADSSGNTPASPTPTPAASSAPTNLTLIIVLCVAGLVIITLVILLVIKSRNKKDNGEQDK